MKKFQPMKFRQKKLSGKTVNEVVEFIFLILPMMHKILYIIVGCFHDTKML